MFWIAVAARGATVDIRRRDPLRYGCTEHFVVDVLIIAGVRF
jgi:hypothetical protein